MAKINPTHNRIAPQPTSTANVGWGDARNPNISTGTPLSVGVRTSPQPIGLEKNK